MKNFTHFIQDHWDEAKVKIKSEWHELTDSDIDDIDGSYPVLLEKLQKIYGYEIREINSQIAQLFEPSLSSKEENAINRKIDSIKQSLRLTLKKCFRSSKRRACDIEAAVMNYSSKNPFQVIGIIAVAGLVFTSLSKRK